ncbi:MAG: hypothetical protein WBG37_18465 [Desulfobacterales bacterium]
MRARTVAWNGIRVEVPGAWELSAIAQRYLAWESQGQPAMELRWNRIRGPFSFERTLKGLWRGRFRRGSGGFIPWLLPEAWTRILAHHRMQGFGWQTPQIKAHGLLLHCRRCATATLIQVFDGFAGSPVPDHQLWESLLAGFQDHENRDEQRLWRIYDLQARLPEPFDLKAFQFQPGHFRLEFTETGNHLTLHRWCPAAVLLGDTDLKGFALGQGLLAGSGSQPQVESQGRRLSWTDRPEACSRLAFWRRQPEHRQGRIWHLEEANRILGLVLAGKPPLDAAQFNDLAANYGLAAF